MTNRNRKRRRNDVFDVPTDLQPCSIARGDSRKRKCHISVNREIRKGYGDIPVLIDYDPIRRLRRESRVSYWVTRSEKLIRKTLSMSPEQQKREIEAAGETPIFSYNQTDFVRDRVAIEIQFGKYAFVAYDLFVKHLAFYVGDQIDVGIEILPMKALQSQMSSGVAYYEGEFYNVVRQGRGVPAVPLVLIGIEP